MTKFFLDCEFIESGSEHPIDLISIGIASDDGREYYAISTEFDESKASDWVKENVIANLEPRNQNGATYWRPRWKIRDDIVEFVFSNAQGQLKAMTSDDQIEFYGWYADYDHVVLCQLFGSMIALPNGFPMYTRDLKQTVDELRKPSLPVQTKGEHNALADAKWVRDSYLWLKQNYSHHPCFGNKFT